MEVGWSKVFVEKNTPERLKNKRRTTKGLKKKRRTMKRARKSRGKKEVMRNRLGSSMHLKRQGSRLDF